MKILSGFCRSLALALLLAPASLPARAADMPMHLPAGGAQRVGAGSLKDPSGVAHSHLAISGQVGVVIFSVPDMSQGPSQRRWSTMLGTKPASRLSDRVALVLVENMAQAGPFKDEARDDMKTQFAKKKRPFLLLDETGDTFKEFAIERDATEILIFDRTGVLRDVEQDLDDQQATVARVKAITDQLLGRHS